MRNDNVLYNHADTRGGVFRYNSIPMFLLTAHVFLLIAYSAEQIYLSRAFLLTKGTLVDLLLTMKSN